VWEDLCNFANHHTQHPITLPQPRKHPITNSIHRATMDAEATIIDLRRARNRERMARSCAKHKEAKRAEKVAKRATKRMIREREVAKIIDLRRASARERTACSRAKKKAKHATERRIMEGEVEATTTRPPKKMHPCNISMQPRKHNVFRENRDSTV
jgi:hypothetical protein